MKILQILQDIGSNSTVGRLLTVDCKFRFENNGKIKIKGRKEKRKEKKNEKKERKIKKKNEVKRTKTGVYQQDMVNSGEKSGKIETHSLTSALGRLHTQHLVLRKIKERTVDTKPTGSMSH